MTRECENNNIYNVQLNNAWRPLNFPGVLVLVFAGDILLIPHPVDLI